MKSTETKLPFLSFTAGVLFTIILIGIYSFSSEVPGSALPPGNSKISVQDANDMFLRYYNSAPSLNARFKGFSVNREEFQAINTLFSKDGTLTACRVYMGKDVNNNDVRIVVGVNSNGLDVVTGGVYQTQSAGSSPCPTICDMASPIVK